MTDETNDFFRMNVKRETKREIDIIAAMEQRSVYEVVADMVTAYKTVNDKAAGGKNKYATSKLKIEMGHAQSSTR